MPEMPLDRPSDQTVPAILPVPVSDLPILSIQVALRVSPLAAPLKLNFKYGSFDTAGPHSAVNTVLPLCSKITVSM